MENIKHILVEDDDINEDNFPQLNATFQNIFKSLGIEDRSNPNNLNMQRAIISKFKAFCIEEFRNGFKYSLNK